MNPPGDPGLRFVGAQILRRRRALAALAAWSLVESVPALVSGRLVAGALDRGFLRDRPAAGMAWLAALGAAGLLGALGTRGLYPWLGEVVEPLRDALVTVVVRGTLARAARDTPGAGPPGAGPVAGLTRQVESVRDVVAGQLLVVRQFAATGVAVCLGLVSLAPRLAVLVALPLVLSLAVFAAMLKPMTRRQRAAFLAEERVARLAGAAIGALRDITAAGVGPRFEAEVAEAVAEQYRLSRALAGYGALRRVVVVFGANVPLLLILLAARPLMRGGLSAGALVGALTYVTVSLEPALRTLVQGVGVSALRLSVAARRIAQIGLTGPDQDPDTEEPAGRAAGPAGLPAASAAAASAARSPGPAALETRGLTFRYGPHADPVVCGLDLRVGPGEHLAVVGASGAGKSTLVNLLAGLLRPDAGVVSLGGRALGEIPRGAVPRLRTLIPQEAYVFAGTVRENAGYLNALARADEIADAAGRVGAQRLIERLGGLDAPVRPELLSAGERQLLALVRAYLSPAAVVLLDEATCHLDPDAERRAEQAFRERPGVLVVVAHRISSALRADRVLLLDGTRTTVGTHRELAARSAQYADLVGHWYDSRAADGADALAR